MNASVRINPRRLAAVHGIMLAAIAVVMLLLFPTVLSAATTNIFSPTLSYQYSEGTVASSLASYEYAEGTVASPFVSYQYVEGVSMSSLVSYQYSEGVLASRIASYQFPEGVASSPVASYYYQVMVDSVGDGIPDLWRATYFGGLGTTTNSLSCATCDPDHDGADNYDEFVADTNPTNALSVFHVQGIVPSAKVVVFFQSSSNRVYTLYAGTNLIPSAWTGVLGQTNLPGNAGILTLTNPSPAALQMFLRVGVQLP